MKPIHYILITLILIGGGIGFYVYREKSKKEIKNSETQKQNDKIPSAKPHNKYPALPKDVVKSLQRKINNVYRLYHKPLIDVDGIYGPDTAKGALFLEAVKDQTPKVANIDDNNGNTYTVNFDKVFSKSAQLIQDLSGYTAVKNLFG